MISFDDYQWLFDFLGHIRIFYLDVGRINPPPSWLTKNLDQYIHARSAVWSTLSQNIDILSDQRTGKSGEDCS